MGGQDLDKDDYVPAPYELVSAEEVFGMKKREDTGRKRRDERRLERLRGEGFEGENIGEVLL